MAEAGRPTVMTEETIRILEEAFSNGASDLEACFLANISKSTLYKYQDETPGFLERKEALKDMIKYQAKKVVKKAIEAGDKQQANWYLERKAKDEGFALRTELTGDKGKDLPTPILAYVHSDNSNTEDTSALEENTSNSGGDVSKQDNLDTPLLDTLISDGQKA